MVFEAEMHPIVKWHDAGEAPLVICVSYISHLILWV